MNNNRARLLAGTASVLAVSLALTACGGAKSGGGSKDARRALIGRWPPTMAS